MTLLVKLLALPFALLLVGCAGATAPGENVGSGVTTAIKFLHDDARGVGCWFIAGEQGSLSCLPDAAYAK